MVYDGATLKFYLNGELNGSVPCAGNILQNNLITNIGNHASTSSRKQFFGFIDEVRIWNLARTQAQIQAFMTTSIPSPTTAANLIGYWIFNSTTNLQGNPTFNGTLYGPGITLSNSNPTCASGLSP